MELQLLNALTVIQRLSGSLLEQREVAPRRLMSPEAEEALLRWNADHFRVVAHATIPYSEPRDFLSRYTGMSIGLTISDYEDCARAGRDCLPLPEPGEQAA